MILEEAVSGDGAAAGSYRSATADREQGRRVRHAET